MSIHVGVFSYYYLPVINGVTLTIADWKKWGEKKGAKFTICVPRLGGQESADPDVVLYPAVPIYKKLGITVPVFPEPHIEKELVRRQVNVLHAHHPFYIGKLAFYFKKKLGLPLVFAYHTRYSDYFVSYLPGISAQFITRIITGLVVKFVNCCDAVTVANETLKAELLRNGVRTPIFIVPPGIDTQRFGSGDRMAGRARLGIDKRGKVLLYVGRLAKEKNVYFLLKALSYLSKRRKDIRLVLTGSGLEESRLRAFARRRGVAGQVVFATRETGKTILDVYAAADIFVYASQTETYGRVMVEAMAAGLPIVALTGPSIVDLLHDKITGRIVFQPSPRRFAEVVMEVLKDKPAALSLGRNAQQVAREQYDSYHSWKHLEDVYRAVAKE